MPRINHYEADVTLRFVIDGPLSPAEAATVAEERARQALVAGEAEGPSVQSAHIMSVSVSDTEIRSLRWRP